jgi:hypothetical protein
MKGLLDKTYLPFMKKIKKTLLKSKQTDQNKLKSKYSNYKRNTLFLNRNFNVTNENMIKILPIVRFELYKEETSF